MRHWMLATARALRGTPPVSSFVGAAHPNCTAHAGTRPRAPSDRRVTCSQPSISSPSTSTASPFLISTCIAVQRSARSLKWRLKVFVTNKAEAHSNRLSPRPPPPTASPFLISTCIRGM